MRATPELSTRKIQPERTKVQGASHYECRFTILHGLGKVLERRLLEGILRQPEPLLGRRTSLPISRSKLLRGAIPQCLTASMSLHRDDDLTLVISRAIMAKGLARIVQLVGTVDDGH